MWHWIKASIDLASNKLGYTVLPDWRMEKYQFSQFLARLFDFLNVDCVLDVGANEGQYYNFLRREVGFTGNIICFEPIPELAALLRQQAKCDPKLIVHEYALGAAEGTAILNVAEYSVFSSFLNPLQDNLSRFNGANTKNRTISCSVRTLSSILLDFEQQKKFHTIFLKLDTQGFDLEVIKGAENHLVRIAALQTEISFRPIYAGMPTYRETIEYLEKHDFVLSGIYPIEGGRFPLLIESDCLMVNKSKLNSAEFGFS